MRHPAPVTSDRLITGPFVMVTGAVFAFFVYVGVLVPILPTYVEDELRGGELGIGLAISSFAVAAIAARPLIGRLIERVGSRAVMIGGGLVAAGAGALYGFAHDLPSLLFLRGVTGVGEAALFVAAATLVADLSPAHRQAEASSYFSVAVYAGLGVGPLLGDALVDRGDFRLAFAAAAVMAAGAAALSVAVPAPGAVRAVGHSAVAAGDSSFVHRAALGPGVVLAFGMGAHVTFTAFLPDHARSLGLAGAGEVFAVYSAVCLVLRIVAARVPERLGPRRAVTFALVTLGAGLALLAAVAQPWALWVATLGIGAGSSFMYPSLMALTINRAPEAERPRAIASFTMFFEIGTATGGLVLGALADSFGKRAGFALAVVVCALGVWWLRTFVVPRRPAAAPSTPAPAPVHCVVTGD